MLLNKSLNLYQVPSSCLEFKDYICNDFLNRPFPEFYPPQYRKGVIYIRKDIRVRRLDDLIIHGKIYECYTRTPVNNAIICAFYTNDKGGFICVNRTCSNYGGYYMLNIPIQYKGKTITIIAAVL